MKFAILAIAALVAKVDALSPSLEDMTYFEAEEQMFSGFEGIQMWTAKQQQYLNAQKAFFKEADKNNTGRLTWYEYWHGAKRFWKKNYGTTEAQCQAVKAQYRKAFEAAAG